MVSKRFINNLMVIYMTRRTRKLRGGDSKASEDTSEDGNPYADDLKSFGSGVAGGVTGALGLVGDTTKNAVDLTRTASSTAFDVAGKGVGAVGESAGHIFKVVPKVVDHTGQVTTALTGTIATAAQTAADTAGEGGKIITTTAGHVGRAAGHLTEFGAGATGDVTKLAKKGTETASTVGQAAFDTTGKAAGKVLNTASAVTEVAFKPLDGILQGAKDGLNHVGNSYNLWTSLKAIDQLVDEFKRQLDNFVTKRRINATILTTLGDLAPKRRHFWYQTEKRKRFEKYLDGLERKFISDQRLLKFRVETQIKKFKDFTKRKKAVLNLESKTSPEIRSEIYREAQTRVGDIQRPLETLQERYAKSLGMIVCQIQAKFGGFCPDDCKTAYPESCEAGEGGGGETKLDEKDEKKLDEKDEKREMGGGRRRGRRKARYKRTLRRRSKRRRTRRKRKGRRKTRRKRRR